LQHVADLEDGSKYDTIMASITQENDLEAFLGTAQLAGTTFVAEKRNVTVIDMQLGPSGRPTGQGVTSSSEYFVNPHLLTADQMQLALEQQKQHQDDLNIPRRPKWDVKTTKEQLQRAEKDAFLVWRRTMARLEEENGLLLTPYERNIEIWRQLWRVIERSHLVVQIVDARNPLLFRSTDLEKYVDEVAKRHIDGIGKRNLLLVNKADFLTLDQRKQWATTFDKLGLRFVFFSAALAAVEQLDQEDLAQVEPESEESHSEEHEGVRPISHRRMQQLELEKTKRQHREVEESEGEDEDLPVAIQQSGTRNTMYVHRHAKREEVKNSTRILSANDLLALFERELADMKAPQDVQMVIGMVGYPNVGKSSTINALLGAKRVSVSATPGKTKHFQTLPLQLSDNHTVTLCDCPGLVFPTFATTKADLVTQGILPVDQLREHVGPVGLLCSRVPRRVLEWTYGIRIKSKAENESAYCTPEEFLQAYACTSWLINNFGG